MTLSMHCEIFFLIIFLFDVIIAIFYYYYFWAYKTVAAVEITKYAFFARVSETFYLI